MKSLIILIIFTSVIFAQNYSASSVNGEVKYRTGTSEEWLNLKDGTVLTKDAFISTGEKSSVKIRSSQTAITINEKSALSVGSIKNMSTDELLLALAMEDMINAPRNNGKESSGNTATYGNKEDNKVVQAMINDFGIKRLNGAVQLARSGMQESAIVFAKETYRKYPDSKMISYYRIFFADILYDKGLYEEALGEYFEIEKLELNEEEKVAVQSKVRSINKILLNN